jgi:hypothetical protein
MKMMHEWVDAHPYTTRYIAVVCMVALLIEVVSRSTP